MKKVLLYQSPSKLGFYPLSVEDAEVAELHDGQRIGKEGIVFSADILEGIDENGDFWHNKAVLYIPYLDSPKLYWDDVNKRYN